jgi:hypothetical protein
LRSLTGRRDLPNQLDLANVVEEIEDVGKSELHAVERHHPFWASISCTGWVRGA